MIETNKILKSEIIDNLCEIIKFPDVIASGKSSNNRLQNIISIPSTSDYSLEYLVAVLLIRLTMKFCANKTNNLPYIKCSFQFEWVAQMLKLCLMKTLYEYVNEDVIRIEFNKKDKTFDFIILDNIDIILHSLRLINPRRGVVKGLPSIFDKCNKAECLMLIQMAYLVKGSLYFRDYSTQRVDFLMPNLNVALAILGFFEKVEIDAGIFDNKNIYRIQVRGNINIMNFFDKISVVNFTTKWKAIFENSEMLNSSTNGSTNSSAVSPIDAARISFENTRWALEILSLDEISDKQKTIANLRINNPEATLSQLSQLSRDTPFPASKHTVLSRLKRVHELAKQKVK